jgi:hypothetical protein
LVGSFSVFIFEITADLIDTPGALSKKLGPPDGAPPPAPVRARPRPRLSSLNDYILCLPTMCLDYVLAHLTGISSISPCVTCVTYPQHKIHS